MKIAFCPAHFHLGINYAPQSVNKRGNIFSRHASGPDKSKHTKDIPALIYGLRGIIYTEVEVRGAKRDLHSGEFGGVAPNPLHSLAIIIAGLKDAEGHIHIPGLYDKVRKPTAEELKF